jgi:basic membrane protein A and related proteins
VLCYNTLRILSTSRQDVFSTIRLLLVGVVLLGCAEGPDRGTPDSAEPFSAALITPGPISDRSWNGGAYQGLLGIRDSLDARVSHVQSRTPAEFEENFRLYGSQGYRLVIGHGFEFQDAALRVAPTYPATVYLVTSAAIAKAPNLAGLRFAFEEPSYLAGFLAGSMTRSGVVGSIGGTELPPVKSSFEAFAAGARAARRDVRVITSYIGNWDDVSAGREQALAQIASGVDVIFQNADAAGLGVFQGARQSRNVWVIGSNADQNDIVPEITLGSVVIDLPRAFLRVARDIQDGSFAAKVYDLGIEADVVRLTLNPQRLADIPATVRERVDSVAVAMRAGSRQTLSPAR